jgi:hypothetical protein
MAETILNCKSRGAGRSARGMDILSMNQKHPRSDPYRPNAYLLNS